MLYMLIGAAIVFAILLASRSFFINQYSQQSALFTYYYLSVLPFSFVIGFNAVLTLYCNSLFKSTFPALFNEVLVRILSIILFTVYFLKLLSLSAFIWLFIGIYGTQTICLLAYIFSTDSPSFNINWELIRKSNFREMMIFGLWMSFVSVASLGIKFIDSLVLAKYYQLHLVGIYTIAAFIPNIIEAPLNALERIAGTKVAHALTHNDHSEVEKIYYRSAQYLLIIGGLLFVGIITNMQFLIQFLPPKFAGGLTVVYIISTGALFNIAGGANSQIIFSSENFWKGGILLIGVAISSIILNIILVPKFGMNGAALATAGSAFLYFASKFVIIYKNFKLQPYSVKTIWVLALITVCIAINFFLPEFTSNILNIAIRTLVMSILYLGGVLLLNLAPEVKELLKNPSSFLKFKF